MDLLRGTMMKLDDPNWQPCGPTVTNYVAEIVFFFFKVAESMLDPSVRLYIYQSVCQSEYPDDGTCYFLPKFPWKEKHVQNLAGNYIMYYKILLNAPAIFLGLFCGAWSDKIGRKLPVMLPCFGTIVATIFYMISMMDGVPALPMILLGAGLRGSFGKSAVITMALHSYVSDISSKGERTTKFGRLLAMNFFGYFVGSLISGTMLDLSGFSVIFCTVVFIDAISFLITLFFMKEFIVEVAPVDSASVPNKKPKMPFHIAHVKESLSVLTRSREASGRSYLIMFYLIVIMQQVCKSGEVDITLLFVEASPLSWRKAMYGYLLALDYACLGVSVFFILPVLSQRYKFDDVTLVVLGLLFKAVRLCLMAFSIDTWMVFMSVVVGCPSAMVISGTKSLISKTVDENEIGKAFSLLSCGETVSNLVGSIIFINMYVITMSFFPGLTFLLDSVLFTLMAGFTYLIGRNLRAAASYGNLDEEEVNEEHPKYPETNGHAGKTKVQQNGNTIQLGEIREPPARPPNSPALRLVAQKENTTNYGSQSTQETSFQVDSSRWEQ